MGNNYTCPQSSRSYCIPNYLMYCSLEIGSRWHFSVLSTFSYFNKDSYTKVLFLLCAMVYPKKPLAAFWIRTPPGNSKPSSGAASGNSLSSTTKNKMGGSLHPWPQPSGCTTVSFRKIQDNVFSFISSLYVTCSSYFLISSSSAQPLRFSSLGTTNSYLHLHLHSPAGEVSVAKTQAEFESRFIQLSIHFIVILKAFV